MAEQDHDHDKARELAEKALDKFVEGDEAASDKLIQQAEKIDPAAIDEVAEELDISDEDIKQAQETDKRSCRQPGEGQMQLAAMPNFIHCFGRTAGHRDQRFLVAFYHVALGM
jgi:hypothetical protein